VTEKRVDPVQVRAASMFMLSELQKCYGDDAWFRAVNLMNMPLNLGGSKTATLTDEAEVHIALSRLCDDGLIRCEYDHPTIGDGYTAYYQMVPILDRLAAIQ
jgi:hypothetical protein